MQSDAATVKEYLASLPDDRRAAVTQLRATLKKHLPRGFEEMMAAGTIGYVVPHKLYPAGYHCDPARPLPFVNLASQKGFVALYHMGLYGMPELLAWFVAEWKARVPVKLDMGKSCVRFKKMDAIPYDLIGELAAKVTPHSWIEAYQAARS